MDNYSFCKLIMNFSSSFIWTAHILLLCCSFLHTHDDLKFGGVSCNYSGITVEIFLGDKFEGRIYSRGNFFNPSCSYFPSSESNTQHKSFSLPLMECGTLIRELNGSTYVSNTVIVQRHPYVETKFDFEHNITCQLSHDNHLNITEVWAAKNITHSYTNGKLEAWMDVKPGSDILGAEQSRMLFIGDKFLLVIHLKDGGVHKDLRVDSCWAYDEDSFDGSRYALHLYDRSSCETLDWLSEFRLTKGMLNVSDSLTYAIVQAFKFPTSNKVHITCSVRVCKYICSDYCNYKVLEKSGAKSRSKRSEPDSYSDSDIRSRYKLMKATVQALGARLIESNKARDSKRISQITESKRAHRANLRKRISITESPKTTEVIVPETTEVIVPETTEVIVPETTEVIVPENTEGIVPETEANIAINNSQSDSRSNPSKDHEFENDIFSNNVYVFNITAAIVVFKGEEDYFIRNPESDQLRYCIVNMRYFILTGCLCFIIFCLFVSCIGMALYMRKEKKRQKLNEFLLYQY